MSDPIQSPTKADLRQKASRFNLELSDEEIEAFHSKAQDAITGLRTLQERWSERERQTTNRTIEKPTVESADPYNSFIHRCRIDGTDSGQLVDCSVGVKDSIAVAGIETTCGSAIFDGYHPRRDATVVTRLLAAGADIVGKLNMDDLAFSASGETSIHGPIRNPRSPNYLAGGSSGGCAAAVVAEEVDIAIGTDQGGSIRVPASWCGCVGLKPTFGLVPYTGIVPAAPTIDHAGPLTRDVHTCARTLEVIAGSDSHDHRQNGVESQDYIEAVTSTASEEITVGMVEEGFDASSFLVSMNVEKALRRFSNAGASTESVSIPWHRDGPAVWSGVATEEVTALVRSEGVGNFKRGCYDVEFSTIFANARRSRADDLPVTLKFSLVLGQFLADEYHGLYHAIAQNLRRDLTEAYDDQLNEYDVLAMPTTTRTAYSVQAALQTEEILERSGGMLANTYPFDVTGHPAISVPCGIIDGLPVGLMLIGERGDDATVLQAAKAFEESVDWKKNSL